MIKISSVSIQQKNKNRCNVYVNDEFFCSLFLETVMVFGVKKDAEFSDSEFETIKNDDAKKYYLGKALDYISKALKTKKEVRTYLLKKDCPENVAIFVISKMTEYGYIDDYDYVKRYIESAPKTEGKKLVDYKLMMKGISKTVIESVRGETSIDGYKNAEITAEKRLKNKEITKEELAKTYRYLLGRGFSFDEADNALKKYKEDL